MKNATTRRSRSATRITTTLASAFMLALSGFGLASPASPASAAGPVLLTPDGLTEASAAASCWEIKQNTPNAPSGVYWLATPALGAPQQFYCDQTGNGGGWVLVGRGREDWSVAAIGSGTPEQVRSTVTGPAAFAPKQLSIETIDALNNDQPIKNLADGIRLYRATNTAGTKWQDFSFRLSSPRDKWTWQFNGQQRVANYTIDGVTYTGGGSVYTSDFGRDNAFKRFRTIVGSSEGWQRGFEFGSNVRGSTDPNSYLWSKSTSTGYARPFTQVYIRPKLMSNDINSTIPVSGTDARTVPAAASGFALPQKWGVAGLGAGPSSVEGSNEVSAFAESGDRVYVGGNFLTVQKTAGGAGAVSQPYIAAFDRDTGEWISTFRPTLDNQVKAIAALPGGKIAIGGFFTQVNGQSRSMLAVLNDDGTLASGWDNSGVINNLAGGGTNIRTLDVQGGWLYAGGKFTHAMGGANTQQWYSRNAVRFSIATGAPDKTWNPELDATVMSIDASKHDDRVYFAGFFAQSRGRDALKAAAMATDSTDLLPWTPTFSNSAQNYQQAVLEVGDRVWLGGSEHSLFSYSRSDFSLLSTSVGNAGGDFQSLATDGKAVYGGCHCFYNQYEGSKTWPNLGTDWTSVDAIYGTGAWSAASGARIPEFNGGNTTSTRGAGSWALMVDSNGTLWQGGDYTSSTKSDYGTQWSGGFIRNAQRDATAPSTPTGLSGGVNADGVQLNWGASTDDVGVTGYQVLRKDRVIATVTGTSASLPAAPDGLKYFVRAVDAAGNLSASTPAFDPSSQPPANEVQTVIPTRATWSYVYDGSGPSGDWTAAGYDASAWATGAAPFGWGQSDLGTTLTTTVSPKPLASFYRKTFQIADMTKVVKLDLTTRADDGVILYVNGTEVKRANMDAGADGMNLYAKSAVSAANALADPVTVEVPGDLLVTGTNVITASVHSNYRGTPSHSFELEAAATVSPTPVRDEPAPPDPEPEPAPTQQLIAPASTWSYVYDADGPSGDWTAAGYDASSWATGEAPFGWGQSDLGTPLTTTVSPKPLASFYRKTFQVDDAAKVAKLVVTTRADDGLILYVNGTEVKRANMDPGADGMGLFASSAVSAAKALAEPVTVEIPVSLLVTGANVITASVHSNYRNTPSHSFELEAVATLTE